MKHLYNLIILILIIIISKYGKRAVTSKIWANHAEEFEEIKTSAIKKLETKHLNSSEWFDDIYSEISTGCYRWTRVKQYVKAIKSVTKEDLIAAYKRAFIPGPEKDERDLMSFRLYGNTEDLPPERIPEFIEKKDFFKVRESIPVLESTVPIHWYY